MLPDAEGRESSNGFEVSLLPCDSEQGRQRSVLLVIGAFEQSAAQTCRLTGPLESEFRTFVLNSALPPRDKVPEYTAELEAALLENGIRRATVLGIGAGAAVAQSLAVAAPKMVRRLVLLNATPRLAPGFLCRTVDRIERFLPLGLPLRRVRALYDSRPELHRIHCPTLLILTADAGQYEREQAVYLHDKIPNCWMRRVASMHDQSRGRFSGELQELLARFLQVQVKCPQKARS